MFVTRRKDQIGNETLLCQEAPTLLIEKIENKGTISVFITGKEIKSISNHVERWATHPPGALHQQHRMRE